MQTPEDVAQMLRLRACRLGIKSIARKTGRSKNALRRYPERHWTTQHQLNDFIKLLRQPAFDPDHGSRPSDGVRNVEYQSGQLNLG